LQLPASHATNLAEEEYDVTERCKPLSLLFRLCNKLYCGLVEDTGNENLKSNDPMNHEQLHMERLYQQECGKVYEAMVLVVFSRLLQNFHLRSLCQEFLLNLYAVPPSCLSLLVILSRSASKAASGAVMGLQRGLRTDSLSLIGSLVFHPSDKVMAKQAFQYLIWRTLSDELKLRNKVIDLIIR
jgi:hypothetical protein